jgi:signal transduction histidine kinase
VKTLTDSRKFKSAFSEFEPDIILIDLKMPYLSGFDIIEWLKEQIPATTYLPVIVLTSDVNSETKMRALQAGANDFLIKPFDLVELQARVNNQLYTRLKNEQVNEYSTELKKLIATKDKFFSIVAHDVRNPFVGIKNYIDIILKIKDYQPDKIESRLRVIYNTADRGHELLENLLKWSRIQTNKIQVERDEFMLESLIRKSCNVVELQAANKQIVMNLSVQEVALISDFSLLETILRNLLSNAIKFTPAGGTVKISADCNHNEILKLTVSDSGVGISPEVQSKLFRIDENLQSHDGTNGEKGSGLGLILCREFVNLLHGSIDVESIEDQGTTFTVHVPVQII